MEQDPLCRPAIRLHGHCKSVCVYIYIYIYVYTYIYICATVYFGRQAIIHNGPAPCVGAGLCLLCNLFYKPEALNHERSCHTSAKPENPKP